MRPNKRFKVTITLEFDVREDQTLEDDKLYNYTEEDWRENYLGILNDVGVSEFLPQPENVTCKVVKV